MFSLAPSVVGGNIVVYAAPSQKSPPEMRDSGQQGLPGNDAQSVTFRFLYLDGGVSCLAASSYLATEEGSLKGRKIVVLEETYYSHWSGTLQNIENAIAFSFIAPGGPGGKGGKGVDGNKGADGSQNSYHGENGSDGGEGGEGGKGGNGAKITINYVSTRISRKEEGKYEHDEAAKEREDQHFNNWIAFKSKITSNLAGGLGGPGGEGGAGGKGGAPYYSYNNSRGSHQSFMSGGYSAQGDTIPLGKKGSDGSPGEGGKNGEEGDPGNLVFAYSCLATEEEKSD